LQRKETNMRAFMPNSFAPATATFGLGREASHKRVRSVLARVRRAAAITLIGLAAVAAIVGMRILLWAIGHPDQPFFRELAKLWS
jgi:hypothetical protein